MVRIALPPPATPPNPLFTTLPAGTRLVRVFDPTTPWKVTALTFNANGPRNRFDHHRPPPPGSTSPFANDPERGIYYAALTLSCCLVEVFGDYHIIDRPQFHIAYPVLNRPLLLLDLCENGAMRAGSVSALCSIADRQLSQSWSRYFYEEAPFQNCDGIRYHSAHNNESAFALYERAESSLECPADQVIALSDPQLRPLLLTIAKEQGMIVII